MDDFYENVEPELWINPKKEEREGEIREKWLIG